MKTDCLIIGFNDSNFDEYVEMVRSMGPQSGAWRDLDLTFIEDEGRRYRILDVLNRVMGQGEAGRPYHNADFLWPVVLYLSTYLHRRGIAADYVNLFHLEKDKLRDKLLHDDILTIAITTTLYVTAHPILEIVSFIRQYNEKVRIVIGGPYIKNQTAVMDPEGLQRLFHYLGADYYVINQEGEGTLVRLLQALKAGVSLDAVDNLAYREGGRFIVTATSSESNTLEENMVDYSLFPRSELGELISLRTAKSCPFSCSFCGFPQRAGKYTYIDLPLVERELDILHELGVTTLTFLDDTFNVPKKRFQEILRLMIQKNYGFHWNSFYRSDHGDPETIELMAQAGCEGVFLGIESGSDEMLKRMNKTSRRKNYMAAIPKLQAVGISCHTNFIVGFPGETYDTVQESIELIEEARPDFYRAQLWYADPVTPIWKSKDQYGVQGEAFNWSHHTMDYQAACDLVDRMFLGVQNSTWLPQYGFEQWSTFYLQRRGMTLDQIKTMVRCFNTAIKEKLTHPSRREVSPEVMRSFEESCRFDRPGRPDLQQIEIWSGGAYKAAELYWGRELAGTVLSSLDFEAQEIAPEPGEPWIAHRCPADPQILARLSEKSGAGPEGLSSTLLAAWATLLSRLNGREEAVVVTALRAPDGWHASPVRLPVDWSRTFQDFALHTRDKTREVMEHRLYGFTIATNPWRMALLGGSCPVLDVGFVLGGEGGAEDGLLEALAAFPEVERGLRLALTVGVGDEVPAFSLIYRRGDLRPESVEQLGQYFVSILDMVSRSPEIRVGDVLLSGPRSLPNQAIETDAREAFTF